MNKNRQNTTIPEKEQAVNHDTGLTPLQEQSAILLASGASITDVAEQLKLNRSTIYSWQKQVTFICFFNRQCADNRQTLTSGLYGMATEALNAIRQSLQSNNEAIRLKTAMWVTEKLQSLYVGSTDATEVLKEECTHPQIKWDSPDDPTLDTAMYKRRLAECGLTVDN